MKNITILVQRDDKNMPFAKVLYNNQDAFNMDYETAGFAAYVARKAVTSGLKDGMVYISTQDGSILDVDSIDRRMDLYYCISGSETGAKAIETLITTLKIGASNLDINAPLFITDGKSEPIWVNEDVLSDSYHRFSFDIVDRIESHKYDRIGQMIQEPVNKGFAKTYTR